MLLTRKSGSHSVGLVKMYSTVYFYLRIIVYQCTLESDVAK